MLVGWLTDARVPPLLIFAAGFTTLVKGGILARLELKNYDQNGTDGRWACRSSKCPTRLDSTSRVTGLALPNTPPTAACSELLTIVSGP